MTPLEKYQQNIMLHGFITDPIQERAIMALNKIFNAVIANQAWYTKLLLKFKLRSAPKGLYLWGRVGSGKTYLMDIFYHCIPGHLKKRQHFHEFMRDVHHRLKQLQGQRNPLNYIAREFAQNAHVICFDEFFVDDIGDAMILGNLLKALFACGVTLVMTSNTKPDNLYKDDAGNDGLQRQRFLPTIELLKQYCEVMDVNSETDYRLYDRKLNDKPRYFTLLNAVNTQPMQEYFNTCTQGQTVSNDSLIVDDRQLSVIGKTDTVLWVDFEELCVKPRNAEDYLQMAKRFQTIFISNIPILSDEKEKAAKRFIYAIDVFYDQGKTLIISADAPIDELYQGQFYLQSFKRTVSRLHEMVG